MKRRLPSALAVVLVATSLSAAEPTPEQLAFFENKIRPLLAGHCYECHSAQAKKLKGGLLLDTQAGLLKGGDTGPALAAGDVTRSLLTRAVRWDDKELRMPPKQKLADAQIADLEAWVKMGAPDPRTGAAVVSAIERLMADGRKHWAFQPVRKPPVPAGAAHPVDAFIRARLSERQLAPAPRADARTLVRRVYFDLVGLPPKPEDVEAFTREFTRPSAYGQLVDKLLASPRHGERWGRHWLDVARYADNMGAIYNNKADYPNAHTYRDYVIRAFNADKPYDEFLREQIAADLLPQPAGDNRALAALGFLTVGRRHDGRVDDNVYDDRIDLLTRGLMGLTAGCARCHDHKLEPISTRDYYALYGILRSCKEPEVYPELQPQADSPERQEFLRENRKLRQTLIEVFATSAADALAAIRARVGDCLLTAHGGGHKKTYDSPKALELVNQRKLLTTPYNNIVVAWEPWVRKNTNVFGPWLEFETVPEGEFAAKAGELAAQFAANADGKLHPLVARLFAGETPKTLSDVAARYNQLFAGVDGKWRALAKDALARARELKPEDLALGAKEIELEAIGRIYPPEQSVTLPDPAEEELRQLLVAKGSPLVFKPEQFGASRLFLAAAQAPMTKASRALADGEAHPGAPARAMVLMEDKPFAAKVFIRGNPNTKGPDAPRQFLEILAGKDRQPFPTNSSGRLEFARAVASPANPLTARVMVNRVWQWHFGEGLVRTPSDFGLRGERPTHPELLDFLTAWFIENGWSLKKLHRLILTSETYQQRSDPRPELAKADPDNRLWARMNARGLEFEPFRDALLAVADRLDTTEGGKPVDLAKTNSPRRTIYAFVDRKSLPNLFRNFDFPDPNFSAAQRGRTAMAPQALYLLNSPFVVECARALAAQVRPPSPGENAAAVRRLHQLVFQREATEREARRALGFLARYPEHDVVMPEISDWQYGFADFDLAAKAVKNFTPLKFTGATVKGAKVGPVDLTALELTPEGGQPAKDKAVVRRWVAPLDGRVDIYAELVHTNKTGDGVTCRLVSSRAGLLGEWSAANTNRLTSLPDIAVRRGDTLDFLTTCGDDHKGDSFKWAPTITMRGTDLPGMKGMAMRWDAKSNFMDPAKAPQPLGPWEELAQVLLLSNEFAVVD